MRKTVKGIEIWFCDGCGNRVNWNIGGRSGRSADGRQWESCANSDCDHRARQSLSTEQLQFEVPDA